MTDKINRKKLNITSQQIKIIEHKTMFYAILQISLFIIIIKNK